MLDRQNLHSYNSRRAVTVIAQCSTARLKSVSGDVLEHHVLLFIDWSVVVERSFSNAAQQECSVHATVVFNKNAPLVRIIPRWILLFNFASFYNRAML